MASALCNGTMISSTLSRRRITSWRHDSPHEPLRCTTHSVRLPAAESSRALAFHNSPVLQGLSISCNPDTCGDSSARRSSGTHVCAKLVTFSGRKEVSIPFQERSLPPGEYLKETERIVNVTFPDSARIKYLGDSVWQARLQSITFFNLSATPCCDVRVVQESGALIIDSNRLVLDVTGLPEQFRNMDLRLALHGELRVQMRSSKAGDGGAKWWEFGGWVKIGVGVDLPLPLSLVPEAVLTGVGNQVVERILGAMEGALLQGIIRDYHAWCALPRTLA